MAAPEGATSMGADSEEEAGELLRGLGQPRQVRTGQIYTLPTRA